MRVKSVQQVIDMALIDQARIDVLGLEFALLLEQLPDAETVVIRLEKTEDE